MTVRMFGFLSCFNVIIELILLLLLSGLIFWGAGMSRVWQSREGRLHQELHVTAHTTLFITSECKGPV